jgi:hypothetical protein
VNETDAGSCPMAGFQTGSAKYSGSVSSEMVG